MDAHEPLLLLRFIIVKSMDAHELHTLRMFTNIKVNLQVKHKVKQQVKQ